MDISETYIKMSDCSEIQGEWKHKEGDFYTTKHPNEKYRIPWVFDMADMKEYEKNYIPLIKSLGKIPYRYVWLPRQDQIQEMVRKDYENTLDMLCDFYGIITVDQPTGFQQMFEVSMEQLWLVFYMYSKHKKIWNGKEWEKKKA